MGSACLGTNEAFISEYKQRYLKEKKPVKKDKKKQIVLRDSYVSKHNGFSLSPSKEDDDGKGHDKRGVFGASIDQPIDTYKNDN